jgi:hypothetical protein
VSEFVSTMNQLMESSGVASQKVDDHIGTFNNVTSRVLQDLAQLSNQFDTHGRGLAQAVELLDHSNRRTDEVIADRRGALEQLVSSLDTRTEDLSDRLSRFANLLDQSLEQAGGRAREIARVVAESTSEGGRALAEGLEAVRSGTEQERRRTVDAMRSVYQEVHGDTQQMFDQASERFTEIMSGMREMAAEMQRELDSTRTELRRGILELPQETADSAAQMRRVIVDQIEALAELNRIVARHGRSLDAVEPARRGAVREEMLASVGGIRAEAPAAPPAAPRAPQRADITGTPPRPDLMALQRGEGMGPGFGQGFAPRPDPMGPPPPPPTPAPPPRRAESPSPSLSPGQAQGNGRGGWLSDLLNRASREEAEPAREPPRRPAEPSPRHTIESLDTLSVDIARMIDHDAAADLWERYQRGERNVFSRRLYTLQGQKAFEEIRRKYRADRDFKQTVDRYIAEFERLLEEVSRDERGQAVARTYLTSETGKVYTMLAHAAGRFE